jgi:chitodextrinase
MGAGAAQGLLLRFTPSPDQDVAGYQVLRKFKDSGDWEQINKGLVPENTFTDKQVEPGKTYLYKVKAVDESGNQSPESKVLEIKHLP